MVGCSSEEKWYVVDDGLFVEHTLQKPNSFS